MTFNIGIDFCGVLYIANDTGEDTKEPSIDMPNAQESLQKLKDDGHDLFLISYCKNNRAHATKDALDEKKLDGFFAKQFYVTDKKFKGEICSRMACHFMIDDRETVLTNINRISKNTITILFGVENHHIHRCAKDWNAVLKIISETPYFEMKENKTIKVKDYIHSMIKN